MSRVTITVPDHVPWALAEPVLWLAGRCEKSFWIEESAFDFSDGPDRRSAPLTRIKIIFEEDADAILFTLKWGGAAGEEPECFDL